MIEIVPATPELVRELGANMRDEDVLEAARLGYMPHTFAWKSFKRSFWANAGLIDGKVYAVWGLCGVALGRTGTPWFLTCAGFETDVPLIDFALIYRREVKKMAKQFPLLENWVDSTYTGSVRLLQIVGFKMDDPVPYGKNGASFRRFWLESEEVAND